MCILNYYTYELYKCKSLWDKSDYNSLTVESRAITREHHLGVLKLLCLLSVTLIDYV
jgi:hypothetical protein